VVRTTHLKFYIKIIYRHSNIFTHRSRFVFYIVLRVLWYYKFFVWFIIRSDVIQLYWRWSFKLKRMETFFPFFLLKYYIKSLINSPVLQCLLCTITKEINPLRSYIGPRLTVWFSSSASMSEDVRHGSCCVCSLAVGACPTLFLM
jgi:hypothetical protein